ncbi:MAG: hypothetical protein M1337_02710 [Actinobacteria bacterium]|nr:hypothetical protein [Actinomycetota bacterium]
MRCRTCPHHHDAGDDHAADHRCRLAGLTVEALELLGCPLDSLYMTRRVAEQARQRALLIHVHHAGQEDALLARLDKHMIEYCRLLLMNTELARVRVEGYGEDGDGRAIESGQAWVGRMGTWRGATERQETARA